MTNELYQLPNLKRKTNKPNKYQHPNRISSYTFLDNLSGKDYLKKILKSDTITYEIVDCFLVLLHLHITERHNDNLIYCCCEDFLLFRGKENNFKLNNTKSGFKTSMKEKIRNSINFLDQNNIIEKIEYKNYNFAILLNEKIIRDIRNQTKISSHIINFNPKLKSWNKDLGLFLEIYKSNKTNKRSQVQVQKLMEQLDSNYSFLAPFQIRDRLEDILDEFVSLKIINGWQYKNIDENMLQGKNWLFYWKLLSIIFDW